jgi:hypothetical protein
MKKTIIALCAITMIAQSFLLGDTYGELILYADDPISYYPNTDEMEPSIATDESKDTIIQIDEHLKIQSVKNTKDKISVLVSEDSNNSKKKILIFDIAGKELFQINNTGNMNVLNEKGNSLITITDDQIPYTMGISSFDLNNGQKKWSASLWGYDLKISRQGLYGITTQPIHEQEEKTEHKILDLTTGEEILLSNNFDIPPFLEAEWINDELVTFIAKDMSAKKYREMNEQINKLEIGLINDKQTLERISENNISEKLQNSVKASIKRKEKLIIQFKNELDSLEGESYRQFSDQFVIYNVQDHTYLQKDIKEFFGITDKIRTYNLFVGHNGDYFIHFYYVKNNQREGMIACFSSDWKLKWQTFNKHFFRVAIDQYGELFAQSTYNDKTYYINKMSGELSESPMILERKKHNEFEKVTINKEQNRIVICNGVEK